MKVARTGLLGGINNKASKRRYVNHMPTGDDPAEETPPHR